MSILRPGGVTREEHHEPCARVVPAEPEKAIAEPEPAQEPGHRVGDFLPLSLTGFVDRPLRAGRRRGTHS
ncbi:hypothetical protein [Streptomyces sp. NPDC015350]|uniref:hypothetical protein n=1 Tax=Streptomyces sp. NPDC015350 TaxID=3364955 RepID=UPI0036FDE5F7